MINFSKSTSSPNGFIYRMNDGSYRERPKWCMNISVPRGRKYVASALAVLRRTRRGAVQA
jgi:hypothetical protein